MSSLSADKQNNHYFILDVLRGLAALSVCIFHLTGNTGLSLKTASFGKYGYLGVDIFFVISGFIIPYSMQKSKYKLNHFFTFLGRRMTRIQLPYVAVILITLLYFFLMQPAFIPKMTIVLSNLFYLHPFFGLNAISPIFWTLAIEFQFYLFIGLFFFLINDNSLIVFLIFVQLLLVIALLSSGFFLNGWIGLFVMGILLFRLKIFKLSKVIFWTFILQATFIIAYKIGYLDGLAALCTVIAINYIRISPTNKINYIFIWLGSISYSLYLIHWEFGRAAVSFAKHIPILGEYELIRVMLGIGMAILLSVILYLSVEKPAIALSKLIIPKKVIHNEP